MLSPIHSTRTRSFAGGAQASSVGAMLIPPKVVFGAKKAIVIVLAFLPPALVKSIRL